MSETRQTLLRYLAETDEDVLALAFVYAKSVSMFGIDVTEKWTTEVQQAAALNSAYMQGVYDARKRIYSERSKE